VLTVALGAAIASLAACGEDVPPGTGPEPAASAPGAGGSTPPAGGSTPGAGGSTPGVGGSTPGAGGSAPGRPAAAPVVHRLGPLDAGKTVTMAVGDRLVVTLPTNRLAGRWTLTGYPAGVLAPELASVPVGGFGLVARSAGSGSVVLTRSGCGPAADQICPSGAGSPAPAKPVTWSVTVVVR
jgi:hypothetical protein